MTPEFNLIQQYFTRATPSADLGVGDDAALISLTAGHQLAISVDMSVVGTHFFADCAAYDIGWKSLAVNVSDMAAMGAMPKWATLAIALPSIDHAWLSEFSKGFFACAGAFNIALIGGDTTRGSLNISVQIMGEVPTGQALKRSGAQLGDDIWVSGHLGSAAVGLAHLQQKLILDDTVLPLCLQALHHPQPRVALGLALCGVAHSCIDVSDGLLADLGHILKASNVGARLLLDCMPCLDSFKDQLHVPYIQQAVLAGGDDYELCFTAPASQRGEITKLSAQLQLPLMRVGEITDSNKLEVYHQHQPLNLTSMGFDHFA